MTEADLKDYADKYFEYNPEDTIGVTWRHKRVAKEQVQGRSLEYTFDYEESAGSGYNEWKYKTICDRPDGSRLLVYSNEYLQVILRVLEKVPDSADKWYEYCEFNDDGQVTLKASSAAVASYDAEGDPFVTLNSTEGLIEEREYYESPDAKEGYLKKSTVKKGSTGDQVNQAEYTYSVETQGDNRVVQVATEKVYQSESGGGLILPRRAMATTIIPARFKSKSAPRHCR